MEINVKNNAKSTKNTILMILNHNFPDVRVCQEADVLTANGYDVYIVVPKSFKSSSPEYKVEDYNLIEVDLSHSFIERLVNIRSYTYSHIYDRILFNPKFKLIENDIFAVHVHDLIWCNLGKALSRKLKAFFVADFHENYPALIDSLYKTKTKKFNLRTLLSRYIRSSASLLTYEQSISKVADKIIVVAKENKTRIINAFSVENNKVHVVSNTKNPMKYENFGLSNDSEIINIFYHGTIQELRGLRTLIDAFVDADNRRLSLTIIGFNSNCEEKKYIIDKFDNTIPTNIELIDWTLNRDLVISKLKRADLCIIPHELSEIGHTTIPNKIFEYMCHGKALLVSDLDPLKRIVDETQSGYIFPAGSVSKLAEILCSVTDRSQLTDFALNARRAACSQYSWSVDANELLALYSDLKRES